MSESEDSSENNFSPARQLSRTPSHTSEYLETPDPNRIDIGFPQMSDSWSSSAFDEVGEFDEDREDDDISEHRSPDHSDCPDCAKMGAYIDESGKGFEEYLHSFCDCADGVLDVPSEGLCYACQHLKPRHLMTCVAQGLDSSKRFPIGNFHEVTSRSNSACPFCCLIGQSLLHRKRKCYPSESFDAHLVFLQLTETGSESASSQDSRARNDKNDSQREFRLCVVGDPHDPEDEPLYVSIHISATLNDHLRELIQPSIRLHYIRKFNRKCLSHHKQCIPTKNQSEWTPSTYMVDVNEMRVVNISGQPAIPFIALSYVWGPSPDPQKLQATKQNMKYLHTRGCLRHKLSSSIKDSMKVCRRLGYRYMWIDRLCIRQDDDDHKKEQLGQMARIYSQADLVLIIASTGTVDDPIPGISIPRSEHIQVKIDGLYLRYSYGDPEIAMRNSTWFSRAWTFQELILAKRRIFITEELVYMQCGEWFQLENNPKGSRRQKYTQPPDFGYGIMDEDSDIMAVSLVKKGGRLPHESLYRDREQYFDSIRSMYCQRSLTNPRDIVNAISGVLDYIYGQSGHLFATPKTDFDRSLLWTNLPSDDTARGRSVDPETAPSWSWTSCEGNIVSEPGRYMDFLGTLVCWFEQSTLDCDSWNQQAQRIRASGHLGADTWGLVGSLDNSRLANSRLNETIWPHLEASSSWGSPYKREGTPHVCLYLACIVGALEHVQSDPSRLSIRSWKELSQEAHARWQTYSQYWHSLIGYSQVPFPSFNISPSRKGSHRVSTRASWRCLHVRNPRVSMPAHPGAAPRGAKHLSICDDRGDQIGIIQADQAGVIHELYPRVALHGGMPVDFIGISISQLPFPERDNEWGGAKLCETWTNLLSESVNSFPFYALQDPFDETHSWDDLLDQLVHILKDLGVVYVDTNGAILNPIPMVNVLLIRWHDDNTAHRIGLGRIWLKKWIEANGCFRDLSLT
ncbi:hypothetical protein AAE478_002080 [Parahypoxylon ruwenzoriense]